VKQPDFSKLDDGDKNDLEGQDISKLQVDQSNDNKYTYDGNGDGVKEKTEYHYQVTVNQLEQLNKNDDDLTITGDNDEPVYIHVDGGGKGLNSEIEIDTTNLDSAGESIQFLFKDDLEKNAFPKIYTDNGAPVSLYAFGDADLSGNNAGIEQKSGEFGDVRIFGNPNHPEPTEDFSQSIQLRGTNQAGLFVHAPNATVSYRGGSKYRGVVWADQWDPNSSGTDGGIVVPAIPETTLNDFASVDNDQDYYEFLVNQIYSDGSQEITLSIEVANMTGNTNFQQTSIDQQK